MVQLTIQSVIALIMIMLYVWANATADAHIDISKRRNHDLEDIADAALVLGVLISDLWFPITILLILAVRFVLFDPIYNYKRGLPFNYVGDTARLDKFFKKIQYWLPGIRVIVIFLIVILITFNFKLVILG